MLRGKKQCAEVCSHRVDMIMRKMFTDMGNAAISNEISCDFMREMRALLSMMCR